jgi:hypothetical protein
MAAFMLFTLLAAGCRHKAPVIAPAAAPPPPLPAKPIDQAASLPPVPPPETPKVEPAGAEQPAQPPPQKPRRAPRRKPKPATTTTPATGDQTAKEASKESPAAAPGTTQQAAAGEPPESSPIGQLSTSGPEAGAAARRDILDAITATEKGLNELKRPLTAQDKETVTQIRTFLTKARQALSQDDLDGAKTLSTKARVLLEELTKG